MEAVLGRVQILPHKQFFFQTKSPSTYARFDWPKNTWRGITLETNIDEGYQLISKAPVPSVRVDSAIMNLDKISIDIVTIEPIMKFDLGPLVDWVKALKAKRVYVGYDSHKDNLPEPALKETHKLIAKLSEFTSVFPKLLREPYPLQTGASQ
jgi:hypothetical protein